MLPNEVLKALPKTFLSLTFFGIAVTSLFCVQPTQAYTITLDQMGSNVVGTGSGAINLTGLTFEFESGNDVNPGIEGSQGLIITGSGGVVDVNGYTGFTGPTSFGSGGFVLATTSSGDFIFFAGGDGEIFLSKGYVSGTPLSDSMTWNNATLASLGVTPGIYEWTWGTGLPNQNFTLIIGGAGVPDGGTTICLLGFGLLGLAAVRRKLSC
jgi:hypothetical protein